MRQFIEYVILLVVFLFCVIYILFFWEPVKELKKKSKRYE